MNTRIIAFVLLVSTVMPSLQAKKTIVWETPAYDFTTARAWWDITRVELTDTATTVYVTHKVIPQYGYILGSPVYLVAPDGTRYKLHSLEGTTLHQWHHKNYSDEEHYRFHFDPLPKNTEWFDFITEEAADGNCYNYFYVHDSRHTLHHPDFPKEWKHLQYDQNEGLPATAGAQSGTSRATLRLTFLNYRHSMFPADEVTVSSWQYIESKIYIGDANGNTETAIDAGSYSFNLLKSRELVLSVDISSPTIFCFSLGNITPGGYCILVPGKTTECMVRLLNIDTDIDFQCEFRGPLAMTNKQMTTHGMSGNKRRGSDGPNQIPPVTTPAMKGLSQIITHDENALW